MGLRERKREAARRDIVAAAYELFTEHGFDDTTVEVIAERANVSARTVYRYFDGKDDIVFNEMSDPDDLVARVRRRCADGVVALPQVVSAVADHLEAYEAANPRLRVLTRLIRENEGLQARATLWRGALAQKVSATLAEVRGVGTPQLEDLVFGTVGVGVAQAAVGWWVASGQNEPLGDVLRAAATATTSVVAAPD